MNNILSKSGFSQTTITALLYLARSNEELAQNQLASYIGITGPSLVRLLDNLESEELIKRCDDKIDRRIKRVVITDKGKSIVKKADDQLDPARKEILKNIPPQDLETCVNVLRTIDAIIGEDVLNR